MSTFSVSANTTLKHFKLFLISNFRRVLNVAFFLLGDSPSSEFYVPTFRNTLSIVCSFFSLGCFPGVLILCADVSEHSVSSICSFLSLGWLPVFWILRADVSEHSVPPMTMEQTTFRNVGTYNSDDAISPKRKNTKLQIVFAVTINTDNLGQRVPKFPFPCSSLESTYLPDTARGMCKLAQLLALLLIVCAPPTVTESLRAPQHSTVCPYLHFLETKRWIDIICTMCHYTSKCAQ